jgi:hypothetical protein
VSASLGEKFLSLIQVSNKDISSTHNAPCRFEDGALRWNHLIERSCCFYASFPPFTREREMKLLCSLRSEPPVSVTCVSFTAPGNMEHPVDMLSFTAAPGTRELINSTAHDSSPKLGPTQVSQDKVGPTPPPRKRAATVAARFAPPRPAARRPQSGPQALSAQPAPQAESTGLTVPAAEGDARAQPSPPRTTPAPLAVVVPTVAATTVSTTKQGSPAAIGYSTLSPADAAARSFQENQVLAFRAHLFREEQGRSATAKVMAVLRKEKEADGKTKSKKVAKLEGQVAAHHARATGLRHQIRTLCEDYWFGGTLNEMRARTGRRVPLVVESCVRALEQAGLSEEGIFRVPGNSESVESMRCSFERNEDPLCDCDTEELRNRVHDISSCLKLFLRELEDPVLTREAFLMWVAIGCDRCDKPHYFCFFATLTDHCLLHKWSNCIRVVHGAPSCQGTRDCVFLSRRSLGSFLQHVHRDRSLTSQPKDCPCEAHSRPLLYYQRACTHIRFSSKHDDHCWHQLFRT